MKALFRILIVATCVGIFLYYTTDNGTTPLEGPSSSQPAIPTEEVYINDYQEAISNPTEGLSLLVGMSANEVLMQYGEPYRRDQAVVGQEWWIYEEGQLMISISNGYVNEVYTNSALLNTSPYTIGQSAEEVYRMTRLDAEVSVTLGENVYIFTMAEQDMNDRVLLQFDTVYAQLYLDETTEQLAGIRFLDGETLVVHQPYEMQYMGELPEKRALSSSEQLQLNDLRALQLHTLVNEFRKQQGMAELETFEQLNVAAKQHSEDMFLQQYMSHDSPTYGSLQKRLADDGIDYKRASENVAMSYGDAIEAVHGLLNSKEHRKEMLGESYTAAGMGVYYDYYTQIFIEQTQIVTDEEPL